MFGERSSLLIGADSFERACGDLYLHESLDGQAVKAIVRATHDAVESINNRWSARINVSKEDKLDQLLHVLVAKRTGLTQREIDGRIGAGVEPLDNERLARVRQLDALPVTAGRKELEHAFGSIMSEINLTEIDILPGHLKCRSPLVNERHQPVEEHGPATNCWSPGELLSSTPFMKFDADTCELFYWGKSAYGVTRVVAFRREDIGVTEMIKTYYDYSSQPARTEAVRREERPGYALEKTIEKDEREAGLNAALIQFTANVVVPTADGHIKRHYETAFDIEGAMLGRAFRFKRYDDRGEEPQEIKAYSIEEANDVLKLRIEADSSLELEQRFGQ
ncbi:hypothetical protein F4X86_01375 [Candidatus Saccharibacteria bacterium]|nr:hypothetical protein [Candidatus Saccharibacteria bacterium]